jgi:hypothetical protein
VSASTAAALIALSVGPCRLTVAVHSRCDAGLLVQARRHETPHIELTTPHALASFA